ncbi:MAG: Glycosyl transferase, family 2 [Candidatus Magasanikbacteria bacterium GW2011_GWA2_56_11]|uniref:Glycosyl transferase, family 2 n=1 Tax=Candidatus Magasanikbacteria bacterium GW2011_GWA2_56_11 TaxID=1619044 RepID=A0A0G1YG21_9BACT|nr:MAG: Glycosyl transferase, family 2 [Candidatus Magasanikbacteria bacterium GW2011_GWA2_56_11]
MFIVLVPAYNESRQIAAVVKGLSPYADEVVVIDDGSRDETARLASEAGATVIVHSLNRGQGAALETGQAYARRRGADAVVHFDGDGQFDPAQIPLARQALGKSGADILFGSRFLDAASRIPPLKRFFLLPAARVVDRFFGTVTLSDAHNGFRLLNRRALQKIVITQDRMAHATEIPALAKRYGLKFAEYPVTVTYHRYGQGIGGGVKIVEDLIVGRFVE